MPSTKTRRPKRKALVVPEAAMGELDGRKKRANGSQDNSHQSLRFVDELDEEFLQRHKRALAKMGEQGGSKSAGTLPPLPPIDMERHHRALAKMQASENPHVAAQIKRADAAAFKAKQASAQQTTAATANANAENGNDPVYLQKASLPTPPPHQFDLERHRRALAKVHGTAVSDPDTAGGPAAKKKRPTKTKAKNQAHEIPNTTVTLEQHRRALAKMNGMKPLQQHQPTIISNNLLHGNLP